MERSAAKRSASNMFWLSEAPDPSVPRATFTPRASISATGAMPDATFMLLAGLWATDEPVSAMSAMSSASSHTAWAAVKRGPRIPTPWRWRVRLWP